MLTMSTMNAVVGEQSLTEVVRKATGSDAEIRHVESASIVENPHNMTTAGLRRCWGELSDGTAWSVVAKTLRLPSASPLWALVPDEFRPGVLANLDWLGEPRIYESALSSDLPEGLRLPEVWHIDRSESSITIWMEDVADHGRWDRERYERSAVALGRLAGRWAEPKATNELAVRRRDLHNLFEGKITHLDLKILSQDEFWRSAPVAGLAYGDLRSDLFALAGRMPRLLDMAEALPHALAHGDAAPANLLEPGDGNVVAIDWSYGSSAPIGSDLGQLLAGRYDCGDAGPEEVHDLIPAIVDGFCRGLDDESCGVDRQSVETAFAIHMGVRTVFSLLVIQQRDAMNPEDFARLVHCRAALARAGLDLCARIDV